MQDPALGVVLGSERLGDIGLESGLLTARAPVVGASRRRGRGDSGEVTRLSTRTAISRPWLALAWPAAQTKAAGDFDVALTPTTTV